MKYLKLVVIFLAAYSCCINAAPQWTGNNAWEGGIGVDAVDLHIENKQIKFKGSDGGSYYYQWDSSSTEMTANANAVLSTLLTALAANKNITLLYDPVIITSGFTNFTRVILLK